MRKLKGHLVEHFQRTLIISKKATSQEEYKELNHNNKENKVTKNNLKIKPDHCKNQTGVHEKILG